MINRQFEALVRQRLKQIPAVVLLGPRQVGKTTLARTLAKDWPGGAIYLDLERPADSAEALAPAAPAAPQRAPQAPRRLGWGFEADVETVDARRERSEFSASGTQAEITADAAVTRARNVKSE